MSKSVKVIVFCAMSIALATVTSMVKVFEFPTGGSITLCSTLFAVLPGYFFGPAVGIAAGFAHGILQFVLGPYILTPVQVFIDYGLAFAAFGVSGFFASKRFGLLKGYLAACVGRWFFSFLSGWLFFGEYAWEGWNAAAYSAVYNIIYIVGEAVFVVILISIPAVSNALDRVKKMALEI
ncbi:MAG: energy-coupled thiamine transporter ThiT [Lachnospiraceae bacterium]|nr:energy-coupled thiamine transporter ThiT [Lachnospiraceae bacterium]